MLSGATFGCSAPGRRSSQRSGAPVRFGRLLFRPGRLCPLVFILVEIPGREREWPGLLHFGPQSSAGSIGILYLQPRTGRIPENK